MKAQCSTCARGWRNRVGGIACGAGVDVDAHPNPIWASRKYGKATILALLSGAADKLPASTDAANMRPDDGVQCDAFHAMDEAYIRRTGMQLLRWVPRGDHYAEAVFRLTFETERQVAVVTGETIAQPERDEATVELLLLRTVVEGMAA